MDREHLEQLVELWRLDPGCQYCGATGDCHPACPERSCGECAGLGMVMDFTQWVGMAGPNPVYAGKPCPRGCPTP